MQSRDGRGGLCHGRLAAGQNAAAARSAESRRRHGPKGARRHRRRQGERRVDATAAGAHLEELRARLKARGANAEAREELGRPKR